jgi:hypothetical protein
VLFAHALVLDADLALGRLAFLGPMFGHPRARGPQTLLAMKNILPDAYPIADIEIEDLVAVENRLGRMLDYGVISARIEELYAASARALGEPRLLDLVRDGAPAYEWPAELRGVWEPPSSGRIRAVVGFATRARTGHLDVRYPTAFDQLREPESVLHEAVGRPLALRQNISE